MGDRSLMDKHPELQTLVAELYVAGESNQAIANALSAQYPELNVHKDTITDYRRHPDVAVMIKTLSEERRTRLTRKIDSKLEARLDGAEEIDTETLLKIRKELLGTGRALKIEHSGNTDGKRSATDKLWEAADADPDAAARMISATADDDA